MGLRWSRCLGRLQRTLQIAGGGRGRFVGLLVERVLEGVRHLVEDVLALLLVEQLPDLDALVRRQGIEDARHRFRRHGLQPRAQGAPLLATDEFLDLAQGLLFLGAAARFGVVFGR